MFDCFVMRITSRVILYDVILGIIYILADVYLVYFYLSNGHKWWAAATITAIALPGTLGKIQTNSILSLFTLVESKLLNLAIILDFC